MSLLRASTPSAEDNEAGAGLRRRRRWRLRLRWVVETEVGGDGVAVASISAPAAGSSFAAGPSAQEPMDALEVQIHKINHLL